LTLHANNYTCHCPFGFDGINCENPINYCSVLDPCRNGVFCTGISFRRSLRQRPMSQLTGQLQLFVRERRWLRTSDYSRPLFLNILWGITSFLYSAQALLKRQYVSVKFLCGRLRPGIYNHFRLLFVLVVVPVQRTTT
jgi:hypothetical protein